MPRFAIEIVKRKTPRPEPPFQDMLVRALGFGLTKGTAFLVVPRDHSRAAAEAKLSIGHGVLAGVPDLVLIHHGQAFGLDLKSRNASLSGEQRAAQVTLRDAGMRVEVARDLDEALMHVRDMGIPLRTMSDGTFRRAHGV